VRVSYTRAGHVSHDYTDHASVLKFIERNWGLAPLTHRSRVNYPNPVYGPENRFAPVNGPAIGDLFDLFQFGS
jgi:phospholipase C